MSRIYGGIHWQFDNIVALDMGRALGEYVAGNFLHQVSLPGTLLLLGLGLVTIGVRALRTCQWASRAARARG
jgi:hypothetical protein